MTKIKILFTVLFLFAGLTARAAVSCQDIFLSETARALESVKTLQKSHGLSVRSVDRDSIEIEYHPGEDSFYSPRRLIAFIQKYPEFGKSLGFEVITADLKSVIYRVPTPEFLNKQVALLRAQGVLPDNGLRLEFTKGQISDLDYIKKFENGFIPVGTNEIFFHDIHIHLVPLLFLPEAYVTVFRQDIALLTDVIPKALARQRAEVSSHDWGLLGFVIDGATAISPNISGDLKTLRVSDYSKNMKQRIEHLDSLRKEYAYYLSDAIKLQIKDLQESYRQLQQ